MIRLLLVLYPKAWRRVYGEELTALLEQSQLTPAVVIDVVAQGIRLHIEQHHGGVLVVAAGLMSVFVELASLSSGVTANVLWPPTTPIRAVALLALLTPWVALVVRATRSRNRRQSVS